MSFLLKNDINQFRSTKIAIVVQRYGIDIVGGAESHARQIAEKLVHTLGCDVTVYTTCAKDYETWKNEYDEQIEYINKVKVLRFKTLFTRMLLFSLYNKLYLKIRSKIIKYNFLFFFNLYLEKFWFILQGPYCPSLVKALKKDQYDYYAIFFFTYLYYPTICGILKIKNKKILIPTAHDEPPFYFTHITKILNLSNFLFVNTVAEKDLIIKVHNVASDKIKIVGLGFDTHHLIKTNYNNFIIDDEIKTYQPYLLYLGRIGRCKNINHFVECVYHYNKYYPDYKIKFIVAGKMEDDIKLSSDYVKYLGFVSEEYKIQLIANSYAIINPSSYESLSMLVLEALVLKKPVILNLNCSVFKYYCDILPTVFGFWSFDELKNDLYQILFEKISKITNEDYKISYDWVINNYSWDKILKDYLEVL